MQKGFGAIYALIGIVVLIAVAGGAYYLGQMKNQPVPQEQVSNATPTTQPTSSNSVSEKASPTSQPDSQKDWVTKKSSYCNVTFTYPPNEAPYFEYLGDSINPQNKRFWQLREAAGASDGHKIFKSSSTLMYVADIEASGYIAGMVGVQCAANTGYTLDNAPDIYASGFGADAGIKVKSKRTTKMWGKDVVAAKFEGGMFSDNEIYFAVTVKNIYKIDKRSDSDKELVRNTTDQIFNSLKFSE